MANEYKICQDNANSSITVIGLQNPENVTVFNLNGQAMLHTLCSGTLDISSLNSGIYLLKIGSGKTLKLPRMGTTLVFDSQLQQVDWFGRGPQENYPDRKSGYRIGRYKTTVDEMFMPYLLPQDCGLRTDNKCVTLSGKDGIGIEFSADKPFNFNCYNYTTENLSKAKYTYQLVKTDGVTFNFDYKTTGVGCTAIGVLNNYQTQALTTEFVSRIKPVLLISK